MQKSFLAGCNVCGRNHTTESCSFLRELKPVQDTKTPSRARLTLPANLEVQNLADNTTTVIARAPFARSIQFGPFIARHTQMLHPAINFPLKVFGKSEENSFFLDTRDEETCNWMCLVSPATSCKEQNLICYQMGQEIYYTVMKDIQPGEQLRVWYAPYYAVKMGAVPFNVDLTSDENGSKPTDHVYESKQKLKEKEKKNFHGMLLSREVTQKLAEQLPARQLGARRVPDRWRCRLCCAEETSVVSFAKHLMSHYKRSLGHTERLLKCHLCHQKFETEKLLVKHKVVRHKIKLQRPRLLDNVEEDELEGVDTAEEANNDMLEEDNGRMTSIVIANLTGELTSQFSQPGAQTIFVTNTGQIYADSLTDNDLQDRQNEALNVLLEQLQSSETFRDKVSQDTNTGSSILKTGTQGNVFPQDNLSEKDNDLELSDANVSTQYEPMEGVEEEEEDDDNGEDETKHVNILTKYKPENVTTVALNSQQNNSENIINIINTHVTIMDDHANHNILSNEKKSKCTNTGDAVSSLTTESSVNKSSEIHDSLFEAFQPNNVVSEEMLPRCQESIDNTFEGQYQVENCAPVNAQPENRVEVMDVINSNIEVNGRADCIIDPTGIETHATSDELRLSVEQDDVSSAFLELVSAPNFGSANDPNSNKSTEDAVEVEEQSLQNDISLAENFDLDVVPEEEALLPPENTKIMDLGPPYNCDICNKEFHKADYLYRHLRKHTGEFTCVSCLAVFARKESLINHACFTDASGEAESTSSLTCPYCQKKFLLKKLFKRHMGKHTGEWKCNVCQRLYSSKTTLASHRCIKKQNPIYQCQVCKREFLRRSYLDRHMLLHLENHPCTSCGKKLKSVEALQNHQLYCTRGKLLETVGEITCPHCDVTFSELVTYRQHIYHHTYPYVCEQCGARFKTESGKMLHTCSENIIKCEVCMKQFSSLFNLSSHQVIHGVPQFHCYECGRSFHQYGNYSSHNCNTKDKKTSRRQKKIVNVGDENGSAAENGDDGVNTEPSEENNKSGGLVCDVCGEVYKTIHILKAHMQLHGERKFVCEICNKKFHRKDVLQEHHSVHQEAQIPCPLCNKKLKTKKSLDVHMHRHGGVTRYSCSDCGKKFFQKGNLLKHAVVHNPNAKAILTCDHCNKNFTSRDYLSQHMLEHTQGRIYQCHLCDKGFVKEHMLKSHIKKFHAGRIYVCPYCNMSVHHRNSIRRHLENRHGELHHEWATPGFLDKLESTGTSAPANTLVNNSLIVSQPLNDPNTVETSSHTSQQINSNTDISLAHTDNQTEGAEILLTVSGMPLSNTGNEIQTPVDQTAIGGQMELQVEAEIQGDEVAVGNTFIFSDGTIIQQEDGTNGGDILLYVLDPGDVAIDPGY